MKVLVECLIENIGFGMRIVRFSVQNNVCRQARVPASACRHLNGQPIADDWPTQSRGQANRAYGLVEAEIIIPDVITLKLASDEGFTIAHARPEAIKLGGGNFAVYRLAVVGKISAVTSPDV